MTLRSTHPATPSSNHVALAPGDALLVVDLQNDFLPGGALGIAGGDILLPVLRRYCDCFVTRRLPIIFSRDWHPPSHCSFREQGGPWPMHCVADTPGSLAPTQFSIPSTVDMIYKATKQDKEVYSVFEDTPLHELLQRNHVRRLFIGGLATDYCVLYSVRDARRLGYEACLLLDGIAAVNRQPGDGQRAIDEMLRLGAVPIRLEQLTQ
jgi:nicotinamidase/pyrazinamidase